MERAQKGRGCEESWPPNWILRTGLLAMLAMAGPADSGRREQDGARGSHEAGKVVDVVNLNRAI